MHIYCELLYVDCHYLRLNYKNSNIPCLKLDCTAALPMIEDMRNKSIAKRAKNDFNLKAP